MTFLFSDIEGNTALLKQRGGRDYVFHTEAAPATMVTVGGGLRKW